MPHARLTPCLWFNGQAEAAANHYISIFPNSRITETTRYGEAGKDIHKQPVGSVLTIAFELDGQPFTALNGGPDFKFTEAISFQVDCDTQQEIDHYWSQLSAGGDPNAQQCGWLKDKFGVSWQVIPRDIGQLISGPDAAKNTRAMNALFGMKKLDIAKLRNP